jgi:hypothetical protein
MAVVYIVHAQVAKAKGGLYHLKKEMYREVDTNWPSFTYVLSLHSSLTGPQGVDETRHTMT